jgi:orotidine-5'-phosphate decarboxylase
LSRNPLIVAADTADLARATELAGLLAGVVAFVKVGLELFTAGGPDVVLRLRAHSPIFLDLKLHDIPTTVERAARNAGRLGVGMLTVHALGGPEMVAAAVRGANDGAGSTDEAPPGIIAVTVLSSQAGEGLASPASLAFEAVAAGAAGVVVSGADVSVVREALGAGPAIVVPGIRPGGQPANDHARVLSPAEALEEGADYIVVGRPIIQSRDPLAAARTILREVGVSA